MVPCFLFPDKTPTYFPHVWDCSFWTFHTSIFLQYRACKSTPVVAATSTSFLLGLSFIVCISHILPFYQFIAVWAIRRNTSMNSFSLPISPVILPKHGPGGSHRNSGLPILRTTVIRKENVLHFMNLGNQ